MLSKTELLYTLALQRTPNLGDTSAKKLLQHVGSAEGIFKEKPSNLLKIHGIGSFKVRQLQQKNLLDLAREELHFIASQNLSYRYFKDPKYPEKLIMVYVALTAVMIVTFFHMIFSAILANYTSKNILNVFSRVIALILASLAIQFIVDGIKSSFGF